MRRTLLFFVLLSYIYGRAYNFEELKIEQGVDQIKDICRDQEGYLWLANGFQGIVGHDSYDSFSFMHVVNDTTSLSHNEVFCMHIDAYNNLWVGTANGLNRFDRETRTFHRYFYKNDWKPDQFNSIFQIYTDADSSLWVIKSNAVCKYNYDTDSFEEYEEPTDVTGIQLRGIVQDKRGRYWIATNEEFLFEFDPNLAILKKVVDPYANEDGLIQKSIHIDHDGDIWLTSKGEGLVKFDPNTKSFKHYPVASDGTGPNGAYIFDLLVKDSKEIVLAVDQGGINVFNKQEERFEYLTVENSDMPGNGVLCLFQDDSGILWIGTSRNGVFYQNPYKVPFHRHRFEEKHGQLDNIVGCFFEDDKQELWVGCDGGGIKVINTLGEEIASYRSQSARWLKSDVIRKIINYGKNGILVIDWNGRLSFKNGGSSKYLKEQLAKVYPAGNIWNANIDSKNRLWIGLPDGTLAVFNEDQDLVGHFLPAMQNLFNDSPMMFEDEQGSFYLSNFMGIFKLNDISDRPVLLIPENRVACFAIKDDYIIVGGVDYGVRIYDKSGQFLSSYTKEKGLSSNIIKSIEIADDGGIWVSTTNGLNLIDLDDGHVQSFYDVDGLVGNQFFMQSSYKTKNGRLYFGGYKGLNWIDPIKMTQNTEVPKMNLWNVAIYEDTQGESRLRELIPDDKPIELTYRERMFVVDYRAVLFSSKRQLNYKYILEGFNENWISVSSDNTSATYTNIDPGEYTFRVKAISRTNLWEDQEVSFKLIVHPPFWKTWWWYSLLVISALAIFLFILWFRTYKLTRDKKVLEQNVRERTTIIADQNEELRVQKEELEQHRYKLEELVDERTKELTKAKKSAEEADALKLRFLANMSHEIRTPMNAIIGFSNIMQMPDLKEEERKTYFNLINSNADALLALIEDIMDISRIEANQLKVKMEEVRVADLVQSQYEYFKLKTVAQQQLELTLEPGCDDLIIISDHLRLSQIVSNLLSNALKYCGEGIIELGLLLEHEHCVIYVKDNGPGIAKKHQDVIFNSFATLEETDKQAKRGVGLGLAISKQLTMLLNGELVMESEPGKGTIVSLKLKLKDQ